MQEAALLENKAAQVGGEQGNARHGPNVATSKRKAFKSPVFVGFVRFIFPMLEILERRQLRIKCGISETNAAKCNPSSSFHPLGLESPLASSSFVPKLSVFSKTTSPRAFTQARSMAQSLRYFWDRQGEPGAAGRRMGGSTRVGPSPVADGAARRWSRQPVSRSAGGPVVVTGCWWQAKKPIESGGDFQGPFPTFASC